MVVVLNQYFAGLFSGHLRMHEDNKLYSTTAPTFLLAFPCPCDQDNRDEEEEPTVRAHFFG